MNAIDRALISPFQPIFQCNSQQKQTRQSRPMCSCDDDDDDMAPECAFLSNLGVGSNAPTRKTSKKRRTHIKKTHTKKYK
jgi:hypothetical protein